MSSVKAQLKAVSDAIKQQNWNDAIAGAKDVLKKDAKSYQALVFLAFALDRKNDVREAEKAYLAATKIKPDDSQAWQGLVKLYRKQSSSKLREYQDAALRLAEIYRDGDDMYKCQDVVDKFIDFARAQGERQQLVAALDVILPGSPIYPALEGRVPPPASTYQTQAQILELEEKKRIDILIGVRRTRLEARLNDVTLQVKQEVFRGSRLKLIYQHLVNWVTEDEVRRAYEEKLLRYCYERLLVWPPGEEKERELVTVQELAGGMVIIHHPFKLAWDIALNWNDYRAIDEWDAGVLREYCVLFPNSDLQKVLSAVLTSNASPFRKKPKQQDPSSACPAGRSEGESEDDEDGGAPTAHVPLTDTERLLIMTEGASRAESLLAYRLVGEIHQQLGEHETNAELMRKALGHLRQERQKTGLEFKNVGMAFSLYLGTALVYHQSPRHHQEAKALFDHVLEHEATCTEAMIGVGLIYEEEEEYEDATGFLTKALTRDAGNIRVRCEAAWVQALKGDYESSRSELEACIRLLEERKPRSERDTELLGQTQYRLGVCIWNLDTDAAARKSRSGAYASFIAALRNNIHLAPAYTSLGIYYADYGKDKRRARKCFQKAVELSNSEVVSAERLARSFADEADWERVELVAQRVVDSGRVRPPPGSKRKGISWPFAALGVAELSKQDFAKAILSFQTALRISPREYHSWLGLAESYYHMGRYMAANKAVVQAQSLGGPSDTSEDDAWFPKFLLASIKRDLGEFDDAVALYQEVAEVRPGEEGAGVAFMQTLVESAWSSLSKGCSGKAAQLATSTIGFAMTAPGKWRGKFAFWKAVADACSIFSSAQSRVTEFPAEMVQELLGMDDSAPGCEDMRQMEKVTAVVVKEKASSVGLTRCLHASILAHKRAVHVSANDVHAQAVAYYNLGWAEHRAHSCLRLEVAAGRRDTQYGRAAVRCFKRAIELEAGNAEFWNAFGVVTSETHPAVAQHAFVRSLHLDARAAHVWTNLGTLALMQNDVGLAKEAFTRAQSTDPEYAHAWLGQGLVALLVGDTTEARTLFTHAVDLADALSLASRRYYAVSVFDHIISGQPGSRLALTSLVQPLFALTQLRRLRPQDLECTHLLALFQERTGDTGGAASALESICLAAEADYEVTESPAALKRFALAKADLARASLARGLYDEALTAGEMALQLVQDGAEEFGPDERRRARLSAHLAIGLARYHAGHPSEAVASLEEALDESGMDPDAVCLLAQILWATGTEEARDRAREVLFGTVEAHPDHAQSILLLGVIGLLDNDAETLEAVLPELEALRVSGRAEREQARVGEVLRGIVALDERSGGAEVLVQGQRNVMLHPYLPNGWTEMAEAGEDASQAAEMAVRVARRAVAPRGTLGAIELAEAYAGTGRAADAQVAVVVAPWKGGGWSALEEAVGVASKTVLT